MEVGLCSISGKETRSGKVYGSIEEPPLEVTVTDIENRSMEIQQVLAGGGVILSSASATISNKMVLTNDHNYQEDGMQIVEVVVDNKTGETVIPLVSEDSSCPVPKGDWARVDTDKKLLEDGNQDSSVEQDSNPSATSPNMQSDDVMMTKMAQVMATQLETGIMAKLNEISDKLDNPKEGLIGRTNTLEVTSKTMFNTLYTKQTGLLARVNQFEETLNTGPNAVTTVLKKHSTIVNTVPPLENTVTNLHVAVKILVLGYQSVCLQLKRLFLPLRSPLPFCVGS